MSSLARARRHLTNWLTRFDPREIPRAEWLRGGWPRAVPLVLLGFLPMALSGPIRFLTGLDLGVALVLAVFVAAFAVAPFAPALWESTQSRTDAIVTNAFVIALGSAAAWLLYNSDFGGLTSFIGPDGKMAYDAASHVRVYNSFASQTHSVYEGFVSLYGFWDPIRRISGDLIVPARGSFMFGVFIVAVLPCIVSLSVLHAHRANRRAYIAGLVVCFASAVAVQYFLVLPLEAFHHMGGFWAQLFGLVPLLALWLVDVLVRPRGIRIAAVVFVAVIYRYTYGLNLPDLLAAVGVLFVVEACGRDLAKSVRIALALAALAALGASVYAFAQIEPLFDMWGWILPHNLKRVLHGEQFAVVALCVTAWWRPARADAAGSGIVRAVRFPLAFGVINIVYQLVIKSLPPTRIYYAQKYSFHAVVLLASSLVVVATFWAATCAARANRRTLSGALLAIVLAALTHRDLRVGFTAYQPGFQEQAFGAQPYQRAQPWYDPGALEIIDDTLQREGKAFGGYFAEFWPMRCFMNALFEFGDPRDPQLTLTAGHCVFWEADEYPELDADPAKRCRSYPQKWNPTAPVSLCARCY